MYKPDKQMFNSMLFYKEDMVKTTINAKSEWTDIKSASEIKMSGTYGMITNQELLNVDMPTEFIQCESVDLVHITREFVRLIFKDGTSMYIIRKLEE